MASSETEVGQCERTGSLGEEGDGPSSWQVRVGWCGGRGEGNTNMSQRAGGKVVAKIYFFHIPCITKLILSGVISNFVGETAQLAYESESCSPYIQLWKQKNITCIAIPVTLLRERRALSSHAG